MIATSAQYATTLVLLADREITFLREHLAQLGKISDTDTVAELLEALDVAWIAAERLRLELDLDDEQEPDPDQLRELGHG
jgi:hypothetical protein